MKIKSDFVTNSSSVTYIIAIPDNFTITLMDIDKLLNSKDLDFYDCDGTPEGIENLLEDVLEKLNELKKGETVYQEDFKHREAFNVVRECLQKNDLGIKGIETSGDGDYKIIPINEAMIIKIIQKMSIYKDEDILSHMFNSSAKIITHEKDKKL